MRSGPDALTLAMLLALTAAPLGAAELLGVFRWDRASDAHGGYSAMELGEDGTHFTILSDRARLLTGRLERENGQITAVHVETETVLRDLQDRKMRDAFGDSEGLAVTPEGIFVSFEYVPRVWFYETPEATPEALPRHPDFKTLPGNGALEALAVDAAGAIYALPERRRSGRSFPVWRWEKGAGWTTAFAVSASGYAMVGADFDDRGRLYLLERKFRGIGFASRLRRISFRSGQPVLDAVIFETPLREHDNLEGLSIWRDAQGRLRATMISDDNFNWFQQTEIVEYALPE